MDMLERNKLVDLLYRIRKYDAKLNDEEHDGEKSRPPDGDDYNELYSDVIHVLNNVLGERSK